METALEVPAELRRKAGTGTRLKHGVEWETWRQTVTESWRLHCNLGWDVMNTEKITVRTESGQTIEVVVLSKRAGCIQVVVGEGAHNVRCELLPTRTGRAYSGTVMGRELVYERSPEEVQADIDRLNPDLRLARRPRRHK